MELSSRFTELFNHWFNTDRAHHTMWCVPVSVKTQKIRVKKRSEVQQMRQGNYMIYRMYNEKTNDYTTEFFLPDSDLKRKMYRLLYLADMKDKGYRVAGILYVDKEAYLNARLANTVEEYLYMDREEQEVKAKYRRGDMNSDVAIKTLEMIQDHKWTLLKKLSMQVRRMVNNDFEIRNEIALALYDEYLKAIL